MGYDCRGVLEAYALVLGSPGMQGRSIVLSVAGRIWLDLEVTAAVPDSAQSRRLHQGAHRVMTRLLSFAPARMRPRRCTSQVLRRVLLVSLHPTVIAKTTVGWEYNRGIFPFIFPEPETVVYLFGLQWTIDMYRFNR